MIFYGGKEKMPKTGIKAPEFTLLDQNGNMHALSDYRGQKVILYFYPKDNTAGCTKQACGFGDRYPQIREKGAVVLGVSKDSVASHQKFIESKNLKIKLLSDPNHELMEKVGAWGTKISYGKETVGTIRSTFIVGKDGNVVRSNIANLDELADVLKELK